MDLAISSPSMVSGVAARRFLEEAPLSRPPAADLPARGEVKKRRRRRRSRRKPHRGHTSAGRFRKSHPLPAAPGRAASRASNSSSRRNSPRRSGKRRSPTCRSRRRPAPSPRHAPPAVRRGSARAKSRSIGRGCAGWWRNKSWRASRFDEVNSFGSNLFDARLAARPVQNSARRGCVPDGLLDESDKSGAGALSPPPFEGRSAAGGREKGASSKKRRAADAAHHRRRTCGEIHRRGRHLSRRRPRVPPEIRQRQRHRRGRQQADHQFDKAAKSAWWIVLWRGCEFQNKVCDHSLEASFRKERLSIKSYFLFCQTVVHLRSVSHFYTKTEVDLSNRGKHLMLTNSRDIIRRSLSPIFFLSVRGSHHKFNLSRARHLIVIVPHRSGT